MFFILEHKCSTCRTNIVHRFHIMNTVDSLNTCKFCLAIGNLLVTCLTSVSWPWISLGSFCGVLFTITISFCKSICCCCFLALYWYVCCACWNFLKGVLVFFVLFCNASVSNCSFKSTAFSVSAFWMFLSCWKLCVCVLYYLLCQYYHGSECCLCLIDQ